MPDISCLGRNILIILSFYLGHFILLALLFQGLAFISVNFPFFPLTRRLFSIILARPLLLPLLLVLPLLPFAPLRGLRCFPFFRLNFLLLRFSSTSFRFIFVAIVVVDVVVVRDFLFRGAGKKNIKFLYRNESRETRGFDLIIGLN